MPRYTIVESVGSRVEQVNSFEDLEKHHPSSGREPGRDYATINGELEEVRIRDGRTYIKKDFVLSQDTSGPVNIPAPAAGYIHLLNDSTNAVRIYDKPFGTPGAVMLAQSLHMAEGTSPREGAYIEYGASMGRMGDVGSSGSVHAHVEAEHATFQRYIRDIANGTIRPGGVTNPLADGVLRNGESGAPVQQLQQQLKNLGYKDAQGRTLVPDSEFGDRTQQALQSFQRAHELSPTGVADSTTLDALRRAQTPQTPAPQQPEPRPQPAPQPPTPQTPPPTQAQWSPTPLSNLIGSGEGGYGSYNRGHAGDSGGQEIDFSRMTVGEIMRRQDLPASNSESLFAVGKFQIIPGTMEETVRRMGVDRNARFTPELQERMFADYLVDEKRPSVKTYITGAGGAQALGSAQLALAQEFASVADPRTGRSFYDGDSAGNSASISPRQIATALDSMREQYRANVAEGMTATQAYAAIGGGAPTQSTPRPTPGAMADGVLRHGESGAEVQQLQRQLAQLGYKDAQGRPLAADSEFGDRTRQAVESFQRASRIEVDGVVGQDTFAALRRAQTPVPVEPMRLGDYGAGVRDLQQRLVAHDSRDARGRPLLVDDDFGPRTREAVMSFQRSHGLDPDGVAGPLTLGALRQSPSVRRAHVEPESNEVQQLLAQSGIEIATRNRSAVPPSAGATDHADSHDHGSDTRHTQLRPPEPAGIDPRPMLSSPGHPDHPLYAQTLGAVRTLDGQRGRPSDVHSENLAGALVVEARRQGLGAVNHVVLSDDGARAFAVQGEPDSVLKRMAYVDTQIAVKQTVAESTQVVATLASSQATRAPDAPAPALQVEQEPMRVRSA